MWVTSEYPGGVVLHQVSREHRRPRRAHVRGFVLKHRQIHRLDARPGSAFADERHPLVQQQDILLELPPATVVGSPLRDILSKTRRPSDRSHCTLTILQAVRPRCLSRTPNPEAGGAIPAPGHIDTAPAGLYRKNIRSHPGKLVKIRTSWKSGASRKVSHQGSVAVGHRGRPRACPTTAHAHNRANAPARTLGLEPYRGAISLCATIAARQALDRCRAASRSNGYRQYSRFFTFAHSRRPGR
jgi:hypothetical protein